MSEGSAFIRSADDLDYFIDPEREVVRVLVEI